MDLNITNANITSNITSSSFSIDYELINGTNSFVNSNNSLGGYHGLSGVNSSSVIDGLGGNGSIISSSFDGLSSSDFNFSYLPAWQNVNYVDSDDAGADYFSPWGESGYPSGYTHIGLIGTAFSVTVIMIIIVVGNMLVCIAIATEKSLKTVQNWFIASLAVSDFLVGIVVMPFSLAKELMGYWIFGKIWCEVHSALDVFLCTASINSLCLISLDRYWSVTHAVEYLRKRTPRRSFIMICGVWILSAIISLPPLVGWKKPEKPSSYPECLLSDDVGYVIYSACGSFYVPAFVMVFVYCKIFVAARSRARRHLKKQQKQQKELCTDQLRSTTTTTCTSFSNASPPGGFSPKVPELPKIPESNGTNSQQQQQEPSGPVVVVDAPEIVIEGDEPSSTKVTFQDQNNLQENSPGSKRQLAVKEPQARRTSLLKTPKFLKSPFGSTLSLADLGGSEEDVSELDPKTGKKRKKKANRTRSNQEEVAKRQPATEAERHKRRVAKAKERRATLILGLIMASFILAWLPFFVLYVLEALCKVCDIGATGFAIAFWLGYCNSALNPIIYTIFNRDFRRAFRKILFK